MKLIAWGQFGRAQRPHSPPANCLAAVRLAIENGFDGMELDVRFSSDNVPVLLHDPTLDRETEETGRVDARTAEQLERVRKGAWRDEPVFVERLETVLPHLPEPMLFMCDARFGPRIDERMAALARAFAAAKMSPERLLLLAYNEAQVHAYKAALPGAQVCLKFAQAPEDDAALFACEAADIILLQCCDNLELTTRVAKACHERSKLLAAYLYHGGRHKLPALTGCGPDFITATNAKHRARA